MPVATATTGTETSMESPEFLTWHAGAGQPVVPTSRVSANEEIVRGNKLARFADIKAYPAIIINGRVSELTLRAVVLS